MENTGNVEEKIIETAKRVFMDKGFEKASMSDIAAEVGISRTAMHYYFRTKDKLFESVFGALVGSFIPKIQDVIQSDMPFFDKMDRIIGVYFRIFSENPSLPKFIVGEVNRDAVHLMTVAHNMGFDGYIGNIIAMIGREMERGTIRRMPIHVIFLSFISQAVFPFLARNMVCNLLCGQDKEGDFAAIVRECEKSVACQMRAMLDVNAGAAVWNAQVEAG